MATILLHIAFKRCDTNEKKTIIFQIAGVQCRAERGESRCYAAISQSPTPPQPQPHLC